MTMTMMRLVAATILGEMQQEAAKVAAAATATTGEDVVFSLTERVQTKEDEVLDEVIHLLCVGKREVEAMRERACPENEEKDELGWKLSICSEIYSSLITNDEDGLWETRGWERQFFDLM